MENLKGIAMIFKKLFNKSTSHVNEDFTPSKSDEKLMVSARRRLQIFGLINLSNGKVIKSIPGVRVTSIAGNPTVFEASTGRAIASILPNGMFNYFESRTGSKMYLTESGRVELRRP